MWKKLKTKAKESAAVAQQKATVYKEKVSDTKYATSAVKIVKKSTMSVMDKLSSAQDGAYLETDFLSPRELSHLRYKVEDLESENPLSKERVVSELILQKAIGALKKGFTNRFLKLMRRFNKKVDINHIMSEDKEHYENDPFWVIVAKRYHNLTAWRYLIMNFGREMVYMDDKPLNIALLYASDEMIRATIEFTEAGSKNEEIERFVDEWQLTQHNMYLFIKCMNEVNSENEVEVAMSVFLKTLLRIIKEKHSFPKEFFNLVYIYQRDFTQQKSLWSSTVLKMKNILDISELNKHPDDWYWFNSNILENPIWIDSGNANDNGNDNGLNFNQLLMHAKSEMSKQTSILEQELKNEIEKNEKVFSDILNLDPKFPKFEDHTTHRQDTDQYGVKANVRRKNCEDITLFSISNFNAMANADFGSYLSALITRAHMIDRPFQSEMKRMFKDKYIQGPVKDIARCKSKALNDYWDRKFPTSACVIDIIRCSILSDTIQEYFDHITFFLSEIKKLKERHKEKSWLTRRNEKKTGQRLKMDIMRCKNGFFEMKNDHLFNSTTKELELPIPSSYCDIKFNVIVQYFDNRLNEKISCVGEVQFLLKIMTETKHFIHRFYSIIRTEDSMLNAFHLMKKNTFEHRMQLAGANPKKLAPLLVDYPLYLNEHFFNQVDSLGLNILMRMAKADIHESLLTHMLKKSPMTVWEHVTKRDAFTLLHFVLMYQSRANSFECFMSHLSNDRDLDWVVDKWKKPTQIEILTPWGMVIKTRDFTHSHSFVFDAIPSNLKSDQDYMCFFKTRSKKNVLHLSVENNNLNCISRLLFFKNKINNDLYHRMLNEIEQRNQCTPLMLACEKQVLTQELLDLLIPKFQNDRDCHSFWKYCDEDGDHVILILMKFGKNHPSNSNLLLHHQLQLLLNAMGSDLSKELLQTPNHNKLMPIMAACMRQSLTHDLLNLLVPSYLKDDPTFWEKTDLENQNIVHILIKYKRMDPSLIEEVDLILSYMPHALAAKLLQAKTIKGKTPHEYLGSIEQRISRMKDGLAKLFEHYLKGKPKPDLQKYDVTADSEKYESEEEDAKEEAKADA